MYKYICSSQLDVEDKQVRAAVARGPILIFDFNLLSLPWVHYKHASNLLARLAELNLVIKPFLHGVQIYSYHNN